MRGDDAAWICGGPGTPKKTRTADLAQKLQGDPTKIASRLKPAKWRAAFDDDGKLVGFQKILKSIVSGGVDHSIRSEVWEFLLGCYRPGTTSDHREKIRQARRDRYKELVEQCRMMHVSIGTGRLAYTVGSKIMDVRVVSKDNARKEAQLLLENPEKSPIANEFGCGNHSDPSTPFSFGNEASKFSSRTSPISLSDYDSSDAEANSDEFVSLHQANGVSEQDQINSPGHVGPNSPNILHTKFFQQKDVSEFYGLQWSEDYSKAKEGSSKGRQTKITAVAVDDEHVRSAAPLPAGMPSPNPISHRVVATEEQMAEWLWTLHRIVIDVVRTDRHLKFYEDTKNMARMSDILAVYAWVDPATGYCQGMSDLLSPFVVLFEDDADAFWCFESLLRRMRRNFQMEGPIGVMKQLEALSKIMEVSDVRVFRHLVCIGADNFIFAFRMLLVLFRRELPFSESLCLWEMMWAADFGNGIMCECLEPLVLKPPRMSLRQRIKEDDADCARPSPQQQRQQPQQQRQQQQQQQQQHECSYRDNSLILSPFCGLRARSFLPKISSKLQRSIGGAATAAAAATATATAIATATATATATVAIRHRHPRHDENDGDGDNELSVFVVAAVLVSNRGKVMRNARSIDDVIKMFNEIEFKMTARSCIRIAIKLRQRYQQQHQQL